MVFRVIYSVLPDDDPFRVETCMRKLKKIKCYSALHIVVTSANAGVYINTLLFSIFTFTCHRFSTLALSSGLSVVTCFFQEGLGLHNVFFFQISHSNFVCILCLLHARSPVVSSLLLLLKLNVKIFRAILRKPHFPLYRT